MADLGGKEEQIEKLWTFAFFTELLLWGKNIVLTKKQRQSYSEQNFVSKLYSYCEELFLVLINREPQNEKSCDDSVPPLCKKKLSVIKRE